MLAVKAELLPFNAGQSLPGWCDAFLDPVAEGELFSTRLWHEALLAGAALPPGAEPVLARSEALLLPLLRQGSRLRALVTDYTLAWRPLPARGARPEALAASGRALGRLFRLRPPVLLDALEEGAPGLGPLLEGLRGGGLTLRRYAHFGSWHEVLVPGGGWECYLAARPPVLRNTIRRKLARATREAALFERIAAPGPALEAGIGAYEDVRARSWKPWEPAPNFDAVLMRALAGAGMLRLGVLRGEGRRPVAAQYWALDRGRRRATVLKLAHAEESRAASPGTALTALMIRSLIEQDGVGELDFGRGDDAYKQLWVGVRRQRVGYLVADPRHPAGLLALARHAAGEMRRRLVVRRGAE
jgi:hypothetical protein